MLGFGVGCFIQTLLQQSYIDKQRLALTIDLRPIHANLDQLTMGSQEIGSLRTMGSQSSTMKKSASDDLHVDASTVAQKLSIIRRMFNAESTYVINGSGKIVAHETVLQKKSIGNVVDWRPYFTTAMSGSANLYPAIGSKSGNRGLYFAAPILMTGEPDSQPIGVIMIKQGIEQIQKILNAYAEDGVALLVSPKGVVFAASDARFESKILGEQNADLLASLHQSKQFGNWFKDKEAADVFLPIQQTSKDMVYVGQQFVFDQEALDLKDSQGDWQIYLVRPANMPLTNGLILLLYLLLPIALVSIVYGLRWAWLARQQGLMLQKQAADQLAETASFMMQLLNTLPSPIFYKDSAGRFLGFNQAYEETFGIDAKELIGKTVLDLSYLSAEDRQMYHSEDMYLINHQTSLQREQDMVFCDQQVHTTLYSVTAFANKDGQPGGLIGIFTDITAQKTMELHLREVHKQIRDSIAYGSLIQHTLLPDHALFADYFAESFVFWEPKDTVGGDLYFLEPLRTEHECFLMMIDCTGHGVPGAFVTMLVKAIERHLIARLVNNQESMSPAALLAIFNRSMKHLLKQDEADTTANAGFDGCIVYINKQTGKLVFAGAETSLFYRTETQGMTEIKGNRQSIGYRQSDNDYVFTDHELSLESGLQIYLTTDGYLDQNGGEKDLPFGKKRFMRFAEACQHLPLTEQREYFVEQLLVYQHGEERNDDITLLSFKF